MNNLLSKQQRLKEQIERALDNFKKVGRNNLTPAKIRSRLNTLHDTWLQFQDGHDALVQATSVDSKETIAYFKQNHFTVVEEIYGNTKDYMREQLELLEPPRSPDHAAFDVSMLRDTSSLTPVAHLPPIDIPPFDGRHEVWISFRDRFTALIRENKDLSDFSRMHYLSSCLKGPALDCIRNIKVTAANFEIAWKALASRYDNPRRLLSIHVSSLLNLPAVTRESASELQTLRDTVNITISSLNQLNRPPAVLWEDLLVHIVSQRFDSVTRKAWTLKFTDKEDFPSFNDLDNFIGARVRALEELSAGTCKTVAKPAGKFVSIPRINVATASPTSPIVCPLCNANHFVNACPSFKRESPSRRREIVMRLKRCLNCLSHSHSVRECPSKYSCRECRKRHHTMLHGSFDSPSVSDTAPLPALSSNAGGSNLKTNSLQVSSSSGVHAAVLLATASIRVGVPGGRIIAARALIDPGSELSFISENLAQQLRVKRIRLPVSVSVVGDVCVGTARQAAHIFVTHRSKLAPQYHVTAHILNSLTAYRPSRFPNVTAFAHVSDLEWADEDPTGSNAIDIILGADLYGDVLLEGVRIGAAGQPVAQQTVFGWVLTGSRNKPQAKIQLESVLQPASERSLNVSAHYCSFSPTLEDEVRRFWELEEVPSSPILSPDDDQCESHFRATHSRDSSGRYIVRLPFKTAPPVDIGNSYYVACRLMNSLARRFKLKPELQLEYSEFLDEYERLGHMQIASPCPNPPSPYVYIPHHPVLREESTTSHLRVVFNASSLTSNGTSLNDHLLTGPKLQTDLTTIILRWRMWKFVLSADIAKMYRQIWVNSQDINYQRILWRSEPSAPPTEYQLLTVTYGMACAPFLALRVLQQLAQDDGHAYPLAKSILDRNIYVDDILFGADSIDSLIGTRKQLVDLLKRGGFTLRKWASNSPALLNDIDPIDHGLACDKTLSADERIKILGIGWNPGRDVFQISIFKLTCNSTTKRSLLSVIARLYDPLGWITPVIIKTKILMQKIWKSKVGWDDDLPESLLQQWTKIINRFNHLTKVTIPRWTGFGPDTLSTEIHGFADASNVAYAAVVYLRVVSPSGNVLISLLAGKSKVAPLSSVTVPRLELCAALLLARLVRFILNTLDLDAVPCTCWTDSTVALEWISRHPSQWKTFIANRVSKIQSLLPRASWRYVPTAENPADCASRGMYSDELLMHSLWWFGPHWLTRDRDAWPKTPSIPVDFIPPETVTIQHASTPAESWDLASRYSSWPKLIRVTAYMLRFITQCRGLHAPSSFPPKSLCLSSDDIFAARNLWLKRIQSELFPAEIRALTKTRSLSARSSLLALRPFLDKNQLLRVGGRLNQAPLPLNSRHPVLLASHPLVVLIIRQTHLRALHAGPNLTLSILRRDFWIVHARGLVRRIVKQCVVCARERAAVPEQLMSDLPKIRVTPSFRSFLHCGVDYAGPVHVRSLAGRCSTARKAYIALFICLTSKAIHLELVSDYTTAAFLNAFARFCSRRGLPESMYSDNGTTFAGADREMTKAYRSALRDPNFLNSTADDGVTWHFIPPTAPHFGGLWEAGVRSVKSHLSRMMRSYTLTFEELYTLLCRIEACLNSRPLAPLSSSIDDFEVLTPGHFTIGSAPTTAPEPSVLDLNVNRLSRWQLVQHITERFWKIWQTDYLNTLQQRAKWRKPQPVIEVGQLVLLRNSSLPPCKWELGRVTQCHPGADGLPRVVTVKTATTEFTRPIVKLCVLPVRHAADAN